MAMNAKELVGYLRASYAKSGRLRIWQFVVQLLIAIPAAISVVVTSAVGSYALAILGVLLLLVWVVINSWYQAQRDGAHTARRAALLVGGLTSSLSPAAVLSLQDRMKVSSEEAAKAQKSDYYASNQPAGPARLAEMLEESAFYSAPLQRASAKIMLLVLAVFALIAATVVLTVPFLERDASLSIVRVLLAVLVFSMSSDVIGAFLAHRDSARKIEDVRTRLMAANSGGYPEADIWLALTDYQSAVESAPESVPFAYKFLEANLNMKWADYQRARDLVRISQHG